MRRVDKEIDNFREIWAIINACATARVAMVDEENKPYVVPMNFGFTAEATGPVFYFHCAGSGQKLDILRKKPAVCIEVDIEGGVVQAEEPCAYSYAYMSVLSYGNATILTDTAEKRQALTEIMHHVNRAQAETAREEEKEYTFSPDMVEAVTVFKVVVDRMSGKKSTGV